MSKRVLLTRRVPSVVLSFLREHRSVDVFTGEGTMPHAELAPASREPTRSMCLLTDRVDAPVIDAAPLLKIIANVAVGYDNIDVAARGRAASSSPTRRTC